ncbi:MAG TPA: methyltransferase domain-containing protein [Candidatus Binataceae bacterium]
MPEHDKWSRWLLETRFGGDEKAAAGALNFLTKVRDRLLDKGGLADGKTVLDVGAGDGLIAFGAVERVGPTGRVIISDVSEPLLDRAREVADQLGVLSRCTFIKARADDLSAIESESVDLVTTRSVLIYVDDKLSAFKEFFRVLKPGARTALFEPIDDRRMKEDSAFWQRMAWGAPGAEREQADELMKRLLKYFEEHLHVNEAMVNFNERDLLRWCIEAGFAGVHTEFDLDAGPRPPMRWETMLNMVANPLVPSMAEIMQEIFSDEERARVERYLRPQVERGGDPMRRQGSYTWAFKAPIPEDPWGRN